MLIIDFRLVISPRTFSCSSMMSDSISSEEAFSQLVLTAMTTEETSGVMRTGTRVMARMPTNTASIVPTAMVMGWRSRLSMMVLIVSVCIDGTLGARFVPRFRVEGSSGEKALVAFDNDIVPRFQEFTGHDGFTQALEENLDRNPL